MAVTNQIQQFVATASKVRDFVKDHGGHTVITRVLIANNGIAAVKEIRSVRQWAYATFGDERAIEFVVMATPEDLKVNAEYIRMADQYVERTGAHAVWAGWGHASENPTLPESLRDSKSKIVFIDKISSTIVAQHADVPTMPWSGDGITDTFVNELNHLEVPEQRGLEQAKRIGFPVMIKASEGGGGKGIRMVSKEADFVSAFYQCQAELAGESRHLEVQVLADQYGNAISLFGRDCSVQRRHQKIIEEAPVTIAKSDTFEQMEKAAVRLAKLVGYVSAGTFYFLELNPRLQVEHPTTEMVSGVNLPAAQLLVSMGIPLHRVRDIRLLYGLDPQGSSSIDYDFSSTRANEVQRKPQPKGHVIAPSSGMMQSLNFRSSTNVWGYFSVSANGGLHEFADSQFGHIFAYGASREQARQAMVVALKEISIRGDFRTTVEYLVRLLEMSDFSGNRFTTAERLLAEFKTGDGPRAGTEQGAFAHDGVRYRFIANRTGPTGWILYINGCNVAVVLVLLDGKSHTCYTREEVGATRLLVDPTQLRSPSPGKLVRFLVESGDHVSAGEAYAEIEVMKMYMPLTASEDGIVQFVLGILTLDDPSRVKHAKPFEGQLATYGPPQAYGSKTHQRLPTLLQKIAALLEKPELPFLEIGEVLSALSSRLPAKLTSTLQEEISKAQQFNSGFPAKEMLAIPVMQVLEDYKEGLVVHERTVFLGLLQRYIDAESVFSSAINEEEGFFALRDMHRDEPAKIIDAMISHAGVGTKNKIILAMLDVIRPVSTQTGSLDPAYEEVLKKLTGLHAKVLLQCQVPSLEERKRQMEHILRSAVTETIYGGGEEFRTPSYDAIKDLIVTNYYVFDVLQSFLYHANPWVRLAALEVYVRRAYHMYSLDLKRIMSVSDLNFAVDKDADPQKYLRQGAMASFDTEANSRAESPALGMRSQSRFAPMSALTGTESPASKGAATPTGRGTSRFGHVINIAMQVPQDDPFDDDTWSSRLQSFTAAHSSALRDAGIRRLTYVLQRSGQHPGTFTFRENIDFGEDKTIRHIEPGLAYQLELPRLANFDIRPCFNDNRTAAYLPCRFFVRVLVRPGRLRTAVQTVDYLISETDRLLSDILDALEILSFEPAYRGFLERHGKRLFRLRVTAAEIRFLVQTGSEDDMPTPFRFCIFNKSGFVPKLENYIEVRDGNGEWVFQSLDVPAGSYNGKLVSTPHQPKEWLQPRRYKAHVMGTTYVYDFPDLFRQAVSVQWARTAKLAKQAGASVPGTPLSLLDAQELVWDEASQTLVESDRDAGRNTCGMVAWVCTMYTPESPQGRRVVVIANDITFKIGSFGVEEDEFFYRATQYARTHGLPRVYLSANSGARIGLAEEVRELFRPAWRDAQDPAQGFEYLYLTEEDRDKLESMEAGKVRSVITEPVTTADGEVRHRLRTIVGATDGLGVENLRGSGLIAGATSRAYEDIFTVTLVTCRSVGIGAYLVRLGQRSVQNEGQPIILTGAPALNKVLGRDVYSSNLQLGGTQIMYKNGVSHLTADNDFAGICKIVRWLAFVPTARDAPLLPIGYEPPSGPSDPRLFLAGADTEQGWLSGFFDRGSFVETLGGWARTVVTGRARLGGIPMGIVAVEGRTVENVIPADPANPASEEQVLQEAGTVWYPNSAYKTAQAIFDFNKGEQLPLMIFANWRGFSGGQRDMFNEVLKYGAYIVDALAQYRQPVFVYIIPNGELRGGAWVVVDPTINQEMMEMYADEQCRAGVLEPEGIVEIKFRKPQMLACMERLDQKVRELRQALASPDLAPEQKAELKKALDEREKALLPVYTQLAVQFADLHDRAGRMVAKGVVRKELQWKHARTFFYFRLKRRLAEEYLLRDMAKTSPGMDREEQKAILQAWFEQSNSEAYDDDRAVAAWYENRQDLVAQLMRAWKSQVEAANVAANVAGATDDALLAALQQLSPERRKQLLTKLSQ
ncbi:hypothetical protein DL89DRAFT_323652 [Linderina pennispora]|uniref:Uncharacterized protein n=1 Tax=Linderina pennispora TaxID=61395 RepID=A0A1Y1W5I4_9FUNG|nr:uncharacterized protein DL89DRAFT_323652 [Linderina pennispora]ORX68799.1 hypothetical protein DL89DRAFT_323652 [Linderina pennispora]